MATNRTDTPAAPTTTAQTNDAARGGLFANPDLTDVVTGVEIAGASMANDSSITINFIETGGTTQTVTFTLNQAANGTFDVTFPDSAPATAAGNPVTSGELINTNLILTKMDGTTVPPIDLSAFAFASEITAVNNRIDNLTFPTMTSDLSDWPTTGLPGQFLELDANRDLVFATPPSAVGAAIRAGTGTSELTNVAAMTGLTVDPALGFELVEIMSPTDPGNGTFILRRPIVIPQPSQPSAGTPPTIPDGSVFAPNMPITTTFNINPGDVGGGITDPVDTNVRVIHTPPSGPTNDITPTIDLTTPTSYDVTIPEDESNREGDYEISTTPRVTIPNPVDPTTPSIVNLPTTTVTYERFAPFFLRGTDILQDDLTIPLATDLEVSDSAWTGEFVAPSGRPTGRVYFAAEAASVPSNTINAQLRDRFGTEQIVDPRVSFVREIQTRDSENELLTYNVFFVNAGDGFTVHSFRTTRLRP